MKPKKRKDKKRSIFQVCFPCFGKSPINCDEMMYNSFGKEFTEYEYVIENLAIRRAPKKLLDAALINQEKLRSCQAKPPKPPKKCEKDFCGYVDKKVPPAVSVGPVIDVEDVPPEEYLMPEHTNKNKITETYNQNVSDHEPFFRYPPIKRPCSTCKAYYSETNAELDDTIIRQILNPHLIYDDTQSAKMQVSADIHTVDTEEHINKPLKLIPTEIKQTIEALKVAKPLHLTSEFSARNHRSLIRSVSTTSCDKETFCNFLDSKPERNLEEVTNQKDILKRFVKLKKKNLPPKKLKSSPSTSDTTHFPDIIECDEIENSDLQITDESGTTPEPEIPPRAQSLKWKIIINKHKKDKIN